MSPDTHQHLVFRLLDTLRGTHSSSEAVDQIAHLLYLKLLDEQEIERSAAGQPCLFEGAAERFRWEKWSVLVGELMVDTLRNGVFPFLASMARNEPQVGDYFRSVEMTITNPAVLTEVVQSIGEVALLRMPQTSRGALFEQLLSAAPSSSSSAQFLTPASVRNLMIELAQPREDDSILDPCCGVGALLAQAAGSQASSATRADEPLRHGHAKRMKGVERFWAVARLARLNMIFHGHSGSNIICGNALAMSGPLTGEDPHCKFSLVLASPPFGGKEGEENVRVDLVKSRNTELLFLALSMQSLAEGGRAVVVVPDGVLFGSTTSHIELRKRLVEDFHLSVISLGSRAFTPRAGVNTNILVFRKLVKPSSQTQRRVWFYELNTDKMTKARASEHLPGVEKLIAAWDAYVKSDFECPPGVPHDIELSQDAADPAGWWATLNSLRENSYVLTPNRYRPHRAQPAVDPIALQAELQQRLRELEGAILGWQTGVPTPSVLTGEWRSCQLSDVTLAVPVFKPESDPDAWFSYVEINSIDRETHFITSPAKTQGKDLPSRARRRLKTGDILVSTVRPSPGGVAIVTPENDGAVASNSLCVLRPNPDYMLPGFLLEMALERSFTQQLGIAAGGVTIPTVSESVIKGLVVRIPPLAIQRDLVQELQQAEKIGRACEGLVAVVRSLQDTIRTLAFKPSSSSERRFPAL